MKERRNVGPRRRPTSSFSHWMDEEVGALSPISIVVRFDRGNERAQRHLSVLSRFLFLPTLAQNVVAGRERAARNLIENLHCKIAIWLRPCHARQGVRFMDIGRHRVRCEESRDAADLQELMQKGDSGQQPPIPTPTLRRSVRCSSCFHWEIFCWRHFRIAHIIYKRIAFLVTFTK